MTFEKVDHTLEEHVQKLIASDESHLTQQASHLTSQELIYALSLLGEGKEEFWKQKTRALINGLFSRQSLEQAGHALNVEQLLDLFQHRQILETKELWKISPIIVGIRPSVFRELLTKATPHELQIFKQEGMTEPVQHHITLLTQDLLYEIDDLLSHSFHLEMEINSLDVSAASDDLNTFIDRIQRTSQKFQGFLNLLNALLEITWNTSRIDLIEKLTFAKTSIQKVINQLGQPGDDNAPQTGLFAKVVHHFENIFKPEHALITLENFDEDIPVLEALTKFSMWYVVDYWELGLLPNVKQREQLNLDPTIYSEKECLDYREQLLKEISQNLENKGLRTVRDLKKHRIFSKKALLDYLHS
ncbi:MULTISPECIES: hypothetical protein [Parachlamydia]|jgi:hypothetical protein|uniref:hypothetical protein n=1 Tax=Parachlamydia TaxID=83551 RepID=UPI0001C174EE|nr:hypothetical protein [Parachlamydia acanthamoebae]EFB41133.1 hypothetical protein pah_c050o104 [Parachlamydia acanthamoebae str. Hall's coccus]